MNRPAQYIWVMPLMIWACAALAGQPQKPMPPSFTIGNDPSDVLHAYPLGTVTRQDAFAHHGGPIHKVALPNGKEGWLYLIGEEAGVPDVYVLEFSADGIVIDVLHKSYHYKLGHSALQYQYLQHVETDVQHLGPRPGEAPGLPGE